MKPEIRLHEIIWLNSFQQLVNTLHEWRYVDEAKDWNEDGSVRAKRKGWEVVRARIEDFRECSAECLKLGPQVTHLPSSREAIDSVRMLQQIIPTDTNQILRGNVTESDAIDEYRHYLESAYKLHGERLERLASRLQAEASDRGNHDPEAPPVANSETELSAATFDENRVFITGKSPIVLDGQELAVVKSLVKMGAATLAQLQSDSLVSQPSAVLKRLLDKHPDLLPYINRPGKHGRGGYRTRIIRK